MCLSGCLFLHALFVASSAALSIDRLKTKCERIRLPVSYGRRQERPRDIGKLTGMLEHLFDMPEETGQG